MTNHLCKICEVTLMIRQLEEAIKKVRIEGFEVVQIRFNKETKEELDTECERVSGISGKIIEFLGIPVYSNNELSQNVLLIVWKQLGQIPSNFQLTPQILPIFPRYDNPTKPTSQ